MRSCLATTTTERCALSNTVRVGFVHLRIAFLKLVLVVLGHFIRAGCAHNARVLLGRGCFHDLLVGWLVVGGESIGFFAVGKTRPSIPKWRGTKLIALFSLIE